MKYCLSGRQPLSLLKKCDEIKMNYEDREKILDFIEQLPQKTIILIIPEGVEEVNWNYLRMCGEKIDLILCLYDLQLVQDCKANGLKFYWAYPITSYFELRGLIELNPCYLFLGAPLSFDLAHISTFNIPIRLCPNLCYDAYIPRENGIKGQWIRPEDVKFYEHFVTTLEFVSNELQRESVLFHIYAEDETWPGNLNLLLTNFNVNVDNRVIPEDIGEKRTVCGQRCMKDSGSCHYCDAAINFAENLKSFYTDMKLRENS